MQRRQDGRQLTYLDGTSPQCAPERALRFTAVGLEGAAALAVRVAARPFPREVVHHAELVAPEDGGAVRYGQYARIDQAFQGGWPAIAGTEACLRPAL
jgi:hypothetical protein